MVETHYHSQPALRDPRQFIASAGHDLRRSGPVSWRLFRSNLRARHQRAGLGYFWLVIPSLATTAIAVYLQSRGVIAVGPTGVPYPAYALTGIVLGLELLQRRTTLSEHRVRIVDATLPAVQQLRMLLVEQVR